MHPYTTTPHSRDRLSIVLCLSFAILAITALYLSSILPAYGALIQTAGLLFLTLTVYIMVRNRIAYVYVIEQEQDCDDWDLVIARIRGAHRITVCRLATKDVCEIDVATRQSHSRIKEKYQSDTVHNYCPTLFPEQSAYLRFADSDPHLHPSATEEERRASAKRIVIRIACDEAILTMLQKELNHR